MLRIFTVTFLALVLLAVMPLRAATPQQEIDRALKLFEAGRYQAAIRRFEGMLDNLSLVEPALIARVHMYLGISYYTVDDKARAEEHFRDLLNFNPQAELDPLYSSPKIRSFFERLQRERETEIQRRRQELEEAARQRAAVPTPLPPVAAVPAPAREPRLPPPAVSPGPFPYYYNFVPFGVGQFKNGRRGKGIFFLSLESATLAAAFTSLTLFELEKDGQGGFKDSGQARLYRNVFLGTFFTFVGSAIYGVVDSLFDYHENRNRGSAAEGWSFCGIESGGVGVRYAF